MAVNILSIDGGGIKGIIPARILSDVEVMIKEVSGDQDKTIADCFDIIAGTTPLIGTMNYGVVWYLEDSPSSVQSVADAGIKTYPNPFYESVAISFPAFMQGNAKIEIYSSVGVLIDQSDFTIGGGEMVFTPEADAKGVYFYRIHIGKEIYEGSFVKM